MPKQLFTVPNISCGHCVKAIQNELSELGGVLKVSGVAQEKSITVEYDTPMTVEKIKTALQEMNYPAQ